MRSDPPEPRPPTMRENILKAGFREAFEVRAVEEHDMTLVEHIDAEKAYQQEKRDALVLEMREAYHRNYSRRGKRAKVVWLSPSAWKLLSQYENQWSTFCGVPVGAKADQTEDYTFDGEEPRW